MGSAQDVKKKKKKTAGGGEQNIDYQMREEQCSKWGK
jgi:hypothetical protein